MGRRIYQWLDERYQLQALVEFMSHKSVPMHRHAIWYYFGGVSFFLFLVQVTTGILLLMYYRVGEDASYESVRFIMSQVRFGWLIRSIHSWGANLMILAVFIHMFSVYFTRAYRKPRELTWVSGFLLLVLALFFGFTGYLLPWNQLAFFATRVGTEIVGSVPFIGRELVRILRGSEEVGGATLARFFGLHVALLPGIFTVLLALHLLFVQRQGLAEPESWASRPEAEKRRMPFFPNFLLRDLLLWLIVLNVLAFLAVFYPWELGPKADPLAPAPPGIKPEWYFLFMYQTLKVLPAKIFFLEGEFVGVLFFTLGGLLWMTVPFWEGKVGKYRNQILYLIGWAVLVYIATMTLWGFRS
ncbi:MAG: cytochrome bc complex cytochrome b subunit [Acidobacteria bacterium]|nr:cytochrome bc complex cytochrome b subunit [Acidobacteriota bacterium]